MLSFVRLVVPALLAATSLLSPGRTQDPPPLPQGHPPVPVTTTPAEHGGHGGTAPAAPAAQDPHAPQDPQSPQDQKPDAKPAEKKPSKRGIAVDDPLVHTHCARCHALDDKQQMTRISYVRKSPEGWSESIKRMGRLHGLQLSPNDAKQLVRSLSNTHGLTRNEAERGLYESERRVHWSEDHHDQDFKRACAQCHTLGRVLLQQRDDEEWQLLRATHVAMFPLARGQMGGGPQDEERRGPFGGGGGGGAAPGGGGGGQGNAAPAGAPGGGNRGRGGNTGAPQGGGNEGPGSSLGVGDRVLQTLAKNQPLFSPEWETWTKNKREVPLAGTWTLSGHEVGRGDLFGTVEIVRTDEDEYDITWRVACSDGTSTERKGKGLLYAGYSWRGRSAEAKEGAKTYREVLLLDDAWQVLKGRLFTGDYDEIGFDVTLQRDLGRTRVLALGNASIEVPKVGHKLDVYGEGFGASIAAADFFVGKGLTVSGVERRSDRHVVLTVDVAADTELGVRTVAHRLDPNGASVTLYDTVDYVRVRPLQGLSRVGGAKMPKQIERYEAYAMHRGKDEKPYTEDDVDLFQVRPKWSLEEFKVRENDDDLKYVGTLDATTGVFTPNIDGPNPVRKWQANNVGDVFVVAEVDLEVPVRPEPKKEPAKDEAKPGDKPAEKPAEAKPEAKPEPKPAVEPPKGPLPRAVKTFRARAHLIVTVPLYVRWNALEWEDR